MRECLSRELNMNVSDAVYQNRESHTVTWYQMHGLADYHSGYMLPALVRYDRYVSHILTCFYPF